MVFFNYALRKLNAKIVYYGPGLCGKTTNLLWIHDHFEGGDRGKMISLATEGDRTIFFDLLPLDIGAIRGMNVTLQLYTVPGQVHYNSTRQLVLRGADGVVFVADSQRAMQSSNIESFRNLQENLLLQGISLDGFPLALQFNKRDLHDTLPVEELDSDLNLYRVPIFEAVATQGLGVQETLEGIVKLVMRNLRERYEGIGPESRTPTAADPATTMRVGGGPKPAAPGPKPVPPPVAPPAKPAAPAKPAPAPRAAPPGGQSVTRQPAPSPRPAPEPAAPRPAASAKPPAAPVKPPAAPARPPANEIVFPEANDARVGDLSRPRSPGAGETRRASGFEDEVSTAVYEFEDGVGSEDVNHVQTPGVAAAPPAKAVPFTDEPTSERSGPGPDHEFATGGGGGGFPDFEMADDVAPVRRASAAPVVKPKEPAAPAPPFDPEPAFGSEEEPEIEFMTPTGGFDAPPPAIEAPAPEARPPRPADRYEDRIDAPSPFAPRPQGGVAAPFEDEEIALPSDLFEAEPDPGESAVVIDGFESEPVGGEADEAPAAVASDGWPLQAPPESPTEPAFAAPDTPTDPAIVVPEPSEPAGELDPFVFGDTDPGIAKPAPVEPRTPAPAELPAAIRPAGRRAVDVRAEDNQLHLRLQGTGAIVESGQVRALDIEVPVPGSWVGNRRVTLQLRLTLTPDSEEENGGSGGHS